MDARLPRSTVNFVFGIILIHGLIAADVSDLKRQKRAVSCEAKYREITTGHTACLEPSGNLIEDKKGASEGEKQIILDAHNTARRGVSPGATNMVLMTWDDEIANTAQRWAERCTFQHDQNYKRYAFGRFSVGQNLAKGYESWSAALTGWEDEKTDFDFNTNWNPQTSSKMIGHYTQMVWATSSKVGCGYARCKGSTSAERDYDIYVCNYGPGGNMMNQKPYEEGTTCAACRNGGKCNNGLCDCGETVCLNGGTLDLNTCTCSCTPNLAFYVAPTCGLNCDLNQQSSNCNLYAKGDCEKYSNVPQICPILCKWCPSKYSKWCPTAGYKPPVGTTKSTDKPKSSTSPTDKAESSTQPSDGPESTTTAKASTAVSSVYIVVILFFASSLVL